MDDARALSKASVLFVDRVNAGVHSANETEVIGFYRDSLISMFS